MQPYMPMTGHSPVGHPWKARHPWRGVADPDLDRAGTVVTPVQGDVWWAESEGRRRPVLVVTCTEAIPVLNRILVAPVSRTIREVPTEVRLDIDDGLPEPCVASFDNLQPIRKSLLTVRLGSIWNRRYVICSALDALADC
jgi:mRNA interferase MazF